MAKFIKLMMAIMVYLLFSVSSMTASAAEKNLPDGFLIDDENGISVDGTGKYLMYVDDLKKKDVITRTLTVRNLEQSGSFKLYMMAEPLETTGPVNWLDNLYLKISLDGRLIYEGRLRGDGGNTNHFIGDGTNMIEKALELGSYNTGEYGVIKFEITVDADHVDYWTFGKKSAADIKWIFTAANDTITDQPKTGEIIRYGLYLFLVVMFTVTVIVFIRYRKLKGHDSL